MSDMPIVEQLLSSKARILSLNWPVLVAVAGLRSSLHWHLLSSAKQEVHAAQTSQFHDYTRLKLTVLRVVIVNKLGRVTVHTT